MNAPNHAQSPFDRKDAKSDESYFLRGNAVEKVC
jgi:hypothetical protein